MILENEFIIPEVRTKSSVAKQQIRPEYRYLIKSASKNFRPLPNRQYLISCRISCSSRRPNLPDAENVTKEIVDTLFPDDSVKVIKGIQTEAIIVDFETTEERTEVYIYRVCPLISALGSL